MREQLKDLSKEYDKSENDLKALQSVGQVCKSTVIYLWKISGPVQSMKPMIGKSIDQSMTTDAN